MDTEKILTQYLHALEKKSYQDIIALFTDDAIVNSPLYGNVKASHFFKELFNDTAQSTLTVIHTFTSAQAGAVHFLYTWELKDGSTFSFECVDVFDIADAKINQLTIIYDTCHVRTPFEKMKSIPCNK